MRFWTCYFFAVVMFTLTFVWSAHWSGRYAGDMGAITFTGIVAPSSTLGMEEIAPGFFLATYTESGMPWIPSHTETKTMIAIGEHHVGMAIAYVSGACSDEGCGVRP